MTEIAPIRILVVDDESAVRRIVRRILSAPPFEVLDADGVQPALDLASQMSDPVDLLLTDVVMPGGTGASLADALRAKWAGLRVLFMSGYTRDAMAMQGVAAEEAFLAKPFTPETLRDGVRRALDGRL
jgi:DNA-binding response OmpR family regulator